MRKLIVAATLFWCAATQAAGVVIDFDDPAGYFRPVDGRLSSQWVEDGISVQGYSWQWYSTTSSGSRPFLAPLSGAPTGNAYKVGERPPFTNEEVITAEITIWAGDRPRSFLPGAFDGTFDPVGTFDLHSLDFCFIDTNPLSQVSGCNTTNFPRTVSLTELLTREWFLEGTYLSMIGFRPDGSRVSNSDLWVSGDTTLVFGPSWRGLERVAMRCNLGVAIPGLFCREKLLEIDNINLTLVPVPAAVWLFGSALLGLGWLRRKRPA